MEIASVDGGFLVASDRNHQIYLATVDEKGRTEKVRPAKLSEPTVVPHQGNTPPWRSDDQHVHFTLTQDEDGRLVDVESGPDGKLVSHALLSREGAVYGGLGARTSNRMLQTRFDERGSTAREDFREVVDVFHPDSLEPSTTIDPDCFRIDSLLTTDWGFVATCVQVAPDAAQDSRLKFTPHYYRRSVIGIVDEKVAWRTELDSDTWWAALGTDGKNILVVENVAPDGVQTGDTGVPYPVRTVRLDATGKPLGEPHLGMGRTSDQAGGLDLVWTGTEYAAIESGEPEAGAAITRYDAGGVPLGTWRIEPDCTWENSDIQLIWTGDAYAACAWHHTYLDDLTDPDMAAECKSIEARLPLYPNLVYDPKEATRDAEIVRE